MAPSVADVQRIVAIENPVVRNLEITYCYSQLAAACVERNGQGANWCTYATWASRQAGRTIRGEDLLEHLERRLGQGRRLLHPFATLGRWFLRRGLFQRETPLGRLTSELHTPFDAFQRASFWQNVTTNTNYHVVLSPTVLTSMTIKPSKAQGGAVVSNPFGGTGKIGEMNINSFDSYLQSYMRNNSQIITPDTVVVFVTDNIYLTSGGCCIGGYHSANNNGQTYMTATYAYSPGKLVFSNDISAFSHEIGEWYADPLITSNSPCGLLETGDPLEGLANYGTFSVSFNGVTWHPQALAMMEYFGDPANFSVNNWLDNQNLTSQVCQHGG